MKNSRIVNAYDRVNADREQKDRMLHNVLQQTQFPEDTKKRARKEGRTMYTAKPETTSKRSVFGTIAACFLVMAIAAVVLENMIQSPGSTYAAPTETEAPAVLQTVESTEAVTLPDEVYDASITYAQVLKLYEQALGESWDAAQCMENGISMLFADYQQNPFEVGYTFLNLDGGEEELIITDGQSILGLYTVTDGEVTRVLTGEARINYTLTADKRVFCRGSGGAALTYFTLYKMVHPNVSEISGLVVEEAYIFDAMTDPDNPWFYSSDGENLGDPCGDFDAEARTEELMAPTQIEFTPFETAP